METITLRPLLSALQPSSGADAVAVLLFLLCGLGSLTRGRLWERPDPCQYKLFERPQLIEDSSTAKSGVTRNIAQRLEDGNYDAVIFWGSQSGTSERLAETLGREVSARFGMNALVADLSDYEAESIAALTQPKIAIFLLSTYGEGDPSDNTSGLWEWIRRIKDDKTRLNDLRYLALGLGNSNYKYYNRVLDVIADTLAEAGATSLLPRAKADDANGATEEDFQSWKEDVFGLVRRMGYDERTVVWRSSIDVIFSDETVLDEHLQSIHHQQSTTNTAIVPLPIKNVRELFTAGDRNCMHLELDLGGQAEVQYKTGDHVGIWPVNPDEEIDRLLLTLGLHHKRHAKITVSALEDTTRPKIPSPATLESLFRHHLEICGPVSRKVYLDLVPFAPSTESKAILLELGQDRERYEQFTANTHVTLARLLRLASPNVPWTSLPVAFVIETLLPLQPRYYSISSSSVISPRRVAITALVVNKAIPGTSEHTIQGLTSNYLLSATELPSKSLIASPLYQQVNIDHSLEGSKVLAHIRKSRFKLPITSSTPLILISAGTGYAPFRAFIAERAKLHAIGKPTGRILLFFGCRHPGTDFIYREELEKMKEDLGDKLQIITAFSRAGAHKVYVQDRVTEYITQVLELLDAGASMYVCGKANMAREVDMRLEEAARELKGLPEADVKTWADGLKKRGKWRADVWG